jgi:MFS family permease
LKIVASHNLGKLGAEEGKPVLVPWRWFYSQPTLPLWIALLLLLVVPKENRNWRAWLILVLPLAALALRLAVSSASADIDLLMQLIVTFACAWASVWLLAPTLSKGNRPRMFFSALGVMLVVGLVSYLSYFGFWCSSQAPVMVICFWTAGSVSLLLALMLSGICCRGGFDPVVLSFWLMLWLPAVTVVGMIGIVGITVIMSGAGFGAGFIAMIIIQILVVSLIFSIFLYLVNLPVMLLARLTKCYRRRLRDMAYRDPFDDDLTGQAAFADEHPVAV